MHQVTAPERLFERIRSVLADQGLGIETTQSLEPWLQLMLQHTPGAGTVSPILDPRTNDLPAEDCLSIVITGTAGPCAWIGGRRDSSTDYCRLLIEIFSRYAPDAKVPESCIVAHPELTGVIAQSGGAYVPPEQRGKEIAGKKMAYYLTRLLRIHALQIWRADWICGLLVERAIAHSSLARQHYGYPRSELFLRQCPHVIAGKRDIWMNWMSNAEALAQIELEFAAFENS